MAGDMQCAAGEQLYHGNCVGKPMANYLVCVENTGGNASEIMSIIKKATNNDLGFSASASVATKAKVVAGGAGVALTRKDELAVVDQVERKFFPGGASACADLAKLVWRQAAVVPHKQVHFPVKRTLSGARVVFFDGFAVVNEGFGGVEGKPLEIELDTPENGKVWLYSGEKPIDVSYKGRNYLLSAERGANWHSPILILNDR